MLFTLLLLQTAISNTASPLSIAWHDAVRNGFSGGAIVVKGDKTILFEVANPAVEQRFHIERGTTLPICSVTKAMTSQVILGLIKERKLSLDGKVGQYISWTPNFMSEISIRQLLTHTSGIRNMDATEGTDGNGVPKVYEDFNSDLAPLKARILTVVGDKPANPPGAKYDYNNSEFLVLQAIAEAVSKKPFERLLRERVFGPAGMRRSGLAPWNRSRSFVDCFSSTAGKETLLTPFNMSLYGGAAGVLSTPQDLCAWLKFTLNSPSGRLIIDAGSQFGGFQGFGGYAYTSKAISKLLGTDNAEQVFERPGAVNGYSLQLSFLPERKLAVALFSNRDDVQLGSVFEGKGVAVDLLVAASKQLKQTSIR